MTFWQSAVVGAVLLTAGSAAMAQAVNYDADYARYRPSGVVLFGAQSSTYNRCTRNSGGVTVTMRDCMSAEYERIDSQLNANYRRIMGRLSQAQQQRLRASQRRWLATRYVACDDNDDGGTLAMIEFDSCALTELTRRTLWLGRL